MDVELKKGQLITLNIYEGFDGDLAEQIYSSLNDAKLAIGPLPLKGTDFQIRICEVLKVRVMDFCGSYHAYKITLKGELV